MHALEEAFGATVTYIRICDVGSFIIVAYNVLGAIFRGIGDYLQAFFYDMAIIEAAHDYLKVYAIDCFW